MIIYLVIKYFRRLLINTYVTKGGEPQYLIYFPVTKKDSKTIASIFVRRKHWRASSGVLTMGSFSFNEVLSTMGTPVRFLNSEMRFQYLGLVLESTVCSSRV